MRGEANGIASLSACVLTISSSCSGSRSGSNPHMRLLSTWYANDSHFSFLSTGSALICSYVRYTSVCGAPSGRFFQIHSPFAKSALANQQCPCKPVSVISTFGFNGITKEWNSSSSSSDRATMQLYRRRQSTVSTVSSHRTPHGSNLSQLLPASHLTACLSYMCSALLTRG